ncbi:SH3 domain-containing protein [Mesorhizobium sp. VNQ89]|uniref:SH3 domain-containing protein n=1 Tax=Mesorhizobium quangtriensis TaxID=3157709 RepID=UPI0032B7EFFE
MYRFSSLRLIAALAAGVIAMPTLVLEAAAAPAEQQPAAAADARRGPSGLPLPRFVSLKSGRVNSRIGPGVNYAVDWLYLKPGLPMEIIQEYDNWRRVRDADGAEGWVNQSLLSGRRTAIAAPWQKGKDARINLLARPNGDARIVAVVEPGAIGSIRSCDGSWCEMAFGGQSGWVSQSQVWGAYPGELVKD